MPISMLFLEEKNAVKSTLIEGLAFKNKDIYNTISAGKSVVSFIPINYQDQE